MHTLNKIPLKFGSFQVLDVIFAKGSRKIKFLNIQNQISAFFWEVKF